MPAPRLGRCARHYGNHIEASNAKRPAAARAFNIEIPLVLLQLARGRFSISVVQRRAHAAPQAALKRSHAAPQRRPPTAPQCRSETPCAVQIRSHTAPWCRSEAHPQCADEMIRPRCIITAGVRLCIFTRPARLTDSIKKEKKMCHTERLKKVCPAFPLEVSDRDPIIPWVMANYKKMAS
ncbi:hypothetical protein NDU88_003004 [Pleurodeles waltl]|uniref:Uncharacterized protein n=1 Tax=Pleurodeles waltl TaxID=8319 RepID=A0AAV7UXS6_PLEWA|nr:hypothetical protein NDU88_003004 [Pleurodeles waltl]